MAAFYSPTVFNFCARGPRPTRARARNGGSYRCHDGHPISRNLPFTRRVIATADGDELHAQRRSPVEAVEAVVAQATKKP